MWERQSLFSSLPKVVYLIFSKLIQGWRGWGFHFQIYKKQFLASQLKIINLLPTWPQLAEVEFEIVCIYQYILKPSSTISWTSGWIILWRKLSPTSVYCKLDSNIAYYLATVLLEFVTIKKESNMRPNCLKKRCHWYSIVSASFRN